MNIVPFQPSSEGFTYATPLLGDDHFIKIGRNEFIQMDGILVHSTNPFDFTIKASMYVCIYYEKLPAISEEESLKIPYPMEVLNCLVDVSAGGTFCWVIIFECELDVIGRGHHIPQGVNLHPHEVFYTNKVY